MKTSPVPKAPPESKPSTDLVETLDAPLSNRAFFIGVSYLARAIALEAALTRGDIAEVPDEGLQILPTYDALCHGYREALDAVADLKRAQQEVLKTFNQSLS